MMTQPDCALPLSHRTAEAALRLSWTSLTVARQQRVIRSVTDLIGTAIAGSARPELAPALLLARPGDIAVPGQSGRFDPPSATLVFGMSGALLQLHDTGRGGAHPGLGVIPAAWAAWRMTGAPLELFLGAVAAGYEITGRIGTHGFPVQVERGFTPTATLGAIGGAVAAGLVLGLDAAGLANAIANAALLCPIVPYESLCGHGTLTPMHGGLASRAGLEAAQLAQAGWSAGAGTLEGTPALPGFLGMLGISPDALTPEDWDGEMLDYVTWKLFPACGACHLAIEAVLRLGDVVPEDIAALEIRVPPSSVLLGSRGPKADELYDTIMSTRWTVLRALVDGAYGPDSVPRLGVTSPVMRALLDHTTLVADPALDAQHSDSTRGAELRLRMVDGTDRSVIHRRASLVAAEDDPVGAVTDSASVALDAKFATLTATHPKEAARLRLEILAAKATPA